MSTPEELTEKRVKRLNQLIRTLPEADQNEVRGIFVQFAADTEELYALVNTAAMAFESLRLADGGGLGRVMFMVTNRTYDVHALLKAIAEDEGVYDE